jgi:hypothetical protein
MDDAIAAATANYTTWLGLGFDAAHSGRVNSDTYSEGIKHLVLL